MHSSQVSPIPFPSSSRWSGCGMGELTPDDMYHGRQRAILSRREKIKRLTLERRKKENLSNAA